MKTIAILATIMAVSAAASAHAEMKPRSHSAGGPLRQGAYCWVYTGGNSAGFWDRCVSSTDATPMSLQGRPRAEIDTILGGGGGDGGGGGGAGGNR